MKTCIESEQNPIFFEIPYLPKLRLCRQIPQYSVSLAVVVTAVQFHKDVAGKSGHGAIHRLKKVIVEHVSSRR